MKKLFVSLVEWSYVVCDNLKAGITKVNYDPVINKIFKEYSEYMVFKTMPFIAYVLPNGKSSGAAVCLF
ncbi:MAG: hypothetical protein OXC44_01775 [Proteobacteria bacterium]|nr:hypothetical protein [Pseudomonadota bacterium]